MKTFKRFLKEQEMDETFIAFVNDTVRNNRVNPEKIEDFVNNEYSYSGLVYRMVVYPSDQILTYKQQDGSWDTKGIADFITKQFVPDEYRFFSKSLDGIKSMVEKKLINCNENQIGVIFSYKPDTSIDISGKYPKSADMDVYKRLQDTEEVLSLEKLTINKIEALYLFENNENGYHFKFDLNKSNGQADQTEQPNDEKGNEDES